MTDLPGGVSTTRVRGGHVLACVCALALLAPFEAAAAPCGDPPDTSGIHTDFEDGDLDGWMPRIGEERLVVTTADPHSGRFSLLITGRQHAFSGPSIAATGKMCNGSQYRLSVWAKLAPGEGDAQLRLSLQRTLGGITNFNTLVGNTLVTAEQWVHLGATVDFTFDYDTLSLYVESADGTPSFYIDDFDLTFIPPLQIEPDLPSVAEALADFFPVGAAVFAGDLSGPHADLLTRHFNSITSENDMKWDATEPAEGAFTFTNADAQVGFARAHGMLVRGHTLVWHNQIPSWVFLDANGNPMTPTPENKALLLQRLANHIRGVATHFGSDVHAWDVVNEVIDPDQPDGFRRSPWFTITGTDYIDTAFRVARDAAPAARLYINDYNTTEEPKRTLLCNLVRDLQNRGVPVDGVGHQMHSNIQFPSAQSVADTVTLFSGLGVENQITELDISIYENGDEVFPDYESIPVDRLIQQGYLYRDFFRAFRALKGQVTSVTFWGEADDHTWLNSSRRVDAPLLFDPSLQHKFAYLGVVNPLELPGADIVTTMRADSSRVFSGQRVSYAITVTNNGPDPADSPSLVDATPEHTAFRSIAAPAGWTCATPPVGRAGQVTCTAGVLEVGAPAEFTLTLAVDRSTPDGATILNVAIAATGNRNPNPDPTNTASVKVSVSNPHHCGHGDGCRSVERSRSTARGHGRAALLVHAAGEEAAVHDDQLAGDEARGIRREKHRGSYELLDLAETLHWRAGEQLLSAR
jgi:endo-1,4-beta-xylanase